jgi:hypothetical protein
MSAAREAEDDVNAMGTGAQQRAALLAAPSSDACCSAGRRHITAAAQKSSIPGSHTKQLRMLHRQHAPAELLCSIVVLHCLL